MYEQINQRAVQEAVQIKMAAATQRYMNDGLRGPMSGETIGTHALRDVPLMDVEYNRLSQSIEELRGSVSELLDRIAPVCQPNGLGCGDGKDANSQKIETTPSDLRAKLIGLRHNIDGISRQIADVKFRIEI